MAEQIERSAKGIAPKRHIIVIIGGGIIGCTLAYYITHHPSYSPETTSVTILEATAIASGASGKAAGLIAKWAYPQELVNITFGEHEQLAREHNGANRWGWRYVNVGQWEGEGIEAETGTIKHEKSNVSLRKKEGLEVRGNARKYEILPRDLDWIKDELTTGYEVMAGDGETAQVHPYLFTKSMCELAQGRDAQVVMGKATNLLYDDPPAGGKGRRAIVGVTYVDSMSGETKILPANFLIIAAGPWTSKLLPQVPVYGTRAHSITVRPTRPVSAYALFAEITMLSASDSTENAATPEIYARPNNEVYVCSPGDSKPLPPSTAEVQVDARVCDSLFKQVSLISNELRGGEVTARQACYLPNVSTGPRGCPIVGEVNDVQGLIIAAGHTCWGICNAPGTAKALSELVMDGKIKCGDLQRLAPRMFY